MALESSAGGKGGRGGAMGWPAPAERWRGWQRGTVTRPSVEAPRHPSAWAGRGVDFARWPVGWEVGQAWWKAQGGS